MKNQDSASHRTGVRWSNRILIVALIGIASLTLFPFRFISADRIALLGSPFLLGAAEKHVTASDVFLNVLLFVPVGFGFATELRKRGGSRWARLLLTMIAGTIISYTIELLQFYIPLRNSGWDDVVTNTMGSAVGFVFFELCGTVILERLSKLENAFEAWLSPGRTATLMLAYFAIWSGMSIPLQRLTRLSDWNPESVLVVGNDATGHHGWQGQLSRLQIWNRALPEKLIEQMAAGVRATDYESSLLASYDFTTPPPFLDETKHLPSLSSVHTASPRQFASSSMAPWKDASAAAPIELTGSWWLSTKVPVEALTRKIQETNQFTVRIVCAAKGFATSGERIVSLSQSADSVNFHLLQEEANLVLWFRNPLSEKRSFLAWYVRDIFQAGQVRDIVASYDGSDAFLYVGGKSVPQPYRLSPGASLWHRFFSLQPTELEGCVLIYEMLIFLPAGFLIGVAARKWNTWKTAGRLVVVFGLLLPPVLLDFLLAWISGRRISPENIFVSALLGVAGILLINADSRRRFTWS